MQEEINKLLTFEIATTVRKQTKKQPLCKGGKADFFYHNTAENLPVERGKKIFFFTPCAWQHFCATVTARTTNVVLSTTLLRIAMKTGSRVSSDRVEKQNKIETEKSRQTRQNGKMQSLLVTLLIYRMYIIDKFCRQQNASSQFFFFPFYSPKNSRFAEKRMSVIFFFLFKT